MSQHLVTLTDGAWQALLRGFVGRRDRAAVCPAGLSRLPDRLEWLVASVGWHPLPDGAPRLLVAAADRTADLGPRLRALPATPDAPTAVLALGVGGAAGDVVGQCHTADGVAPLDELRVAGPGLPRVALASREHSAGVEEPYWSRTAGALGEATFRRLRGLHVAVVGCGRSGSLTASALRRLGVSRLTLIDGDLLKPHNLGEMDAVTAADLGRPKALALAEALRDGPGTTDVRAVGESILSLPALAAAKGAGVLFCCVDNPAARRASSLLATRYLKPLLDVGTGIFGEGGRRRMGADVRLTLPGRCLLCLGGVGDLVQARAELFAAPEPRPVLDGAWRRQRAGSLRSLNGIAVNLALRLLEDLTDGRVRESAWLRVDVDDEGVPSVAVRRTETHRLCEGCGQTGRGDGTSSIPRWGERAPI